MQVATKFFTVSFFLIITLFAPTWPAETPPLSLIEEFDDLLFSDDDCNLEELFAMNNNQNGCTPTLATLRKEFGRLMLFELMVIPGLTNRRQTSISRIISVGNRFIDQLVTSIRRYNPALNSRTFASSSRNIIRRLANALERGRLDDRTTQRALNNEFSNVTQFWKESISPDYNSVRVNANFDRAISILAKIESLHFNQRAPTNEQFHLYNTLTTSILEVLDN